MGNPLVRVRDLLVRPGLAGLLVDCRSDYAEQCAEDYIMSRAQFDDVQALVADAKRVLPSVGGVWLVGGLFFGILFYYAPILFIIGLVGFLRGLFTGNVAGRSE